MGVGGGGGRPSIARSIHVAKWRIRAYKTYRFDTAGFNAITHPEPEALPKNLNCRMGSPSSANQGPSRSLDSYR